MILLTGGSGLLGRELIKQFPHKIIAPTHNELDVTKPDQIKRYIEAYNPDYIIHAAALTGLSRCEGDKSKAYHLNVGGTMNICKIADTLNKRIVYISTDYVFDGKEGNYNELHVPNPLSYYAKTKAMGEISAMHSAHHVFRTSFCNKVWPYPRAYFDKYSSFDTVDIIADLILKCAETLHTRLYKPMILHIGTEHKSFYDLANKISKGCVLSSPLMDDNVPKDTSLDTTKMKTILGI